MTGQEARDDVAEAAREVYLAEETVGRLTLEEGRGTRRWIEARMALHVARVKLAAARGVQR